MRNDLLRTLVKFYEEDPLDPFNVYALALEYLKSDPDSAGRLFEVLLTEHPGYLPTYYHAASLFASQGTFEKAEKVYTKGIALALEQRQTKTHQELLRAYRGFLDELDD